MFNVFKLSLSNCFPPFLTVTCDVLDDNCLDVGKEVFAMYI